MGPASVRRQLLIQILDNASLNIPNESMINEQAEFVVGRPPILGC